MRSSAAAMTTAAYIGNAETVRANAHKLVEDKDLLNDMLKNVDGADVVAIKQLLDDIENLIVADKKLQTSS